MKRTKSLNDLVNYIEKLETAHELLHEIFLGFDNTTAVAHLSLPTYRKLQDYFNINEDK
jgi:hypothetical protein